MSDYFIGLTGGIASGKSALEREFTARGIYVADADLIARQIVEPGEPTLAAVVAEFGTSVLDAEGRLDRAGLRAKVFGNDAARHALEAILHPVIRLRLRAQCEAADSVYAIAAIPLLTEGGGRTAYPWLHRILVVDAPPATQKARLMQRDGIDDSLAVQMMAAQATRAQRLALADDIVVNDGDLSDLAKAAEELHVRYAAFAGHPQGYAQRNSG
ncbi:MAG: dephospho-CoA kinase [Pseudoxanthomonas sp.]